MGIWEAQCTSFEMTIDDKNTSLVEKGLEIGNTIEYEM